MTPRSSAVLAAAQAIALFLVVTGCGGDDAEPERPASQPTLVAQIDQLRRDQVLGRVQIGVVNGGAETVVVESLHVRIPGFGSSVPVDKDSPVPPGQRVNLPWPYGKVRCGADRASATGRSTVTLRLHTASDPTSRTVQLAAADPDALMRRIADRTCAVERVRREVDLRFGRSWRVEQGRDGVMLHGTLRARLLVDSPRHVTDVRGAIMYGLRPDESVGAVGNPLAVLSADRPAASIPVVAYAARCDAHTIGEIKKPYEFLVWIALPGEEPLAVTPAVNQATKEALRLACAF